MVRRKLIVSKLIIFQIMYREGDSGKTKTSLSISRILDLVIHTTHYFFKDLFISIGG